MKNILLLLLLFLVNVSFGQTERSINKSISENFVKNYNADDFDAIFSMFSEIMRDALPLNKTREFLTGLKTQAGNISNHEFIKYENGTYASYKTTFERALFILNISLDENSEINGLFVKPYVEAISSENMINHLSAKDYAITKKQSEIIFNNAKIFPKHTEIAFALIRNGEVSYYGSKRRDDTLSNIENQKSIFEIGSITKVFTSTLLSSFVIDKKIDLNDTINDYVNLPFNKQTKISFQGLSNHTSGLPRLPSNLNLATADPENPYKDYDEGDLEEYLGKILELAPNFSKKYEYSNLGAGLLGYILGTIENRSYEDLLENRIFSKYHMLSSTTQLNKVSGELVKGLNTEGIEVPNWSFSVLAGAGAILSNVVDLSKFALAQFDDSNKELELTRQKTFEINSNLSIGLGWHLIKIREDNHWVWHNGATGGYTSSMAIDPLNKNGVIILSNVSAFNPNMGKIDNLCFELMKTLEEE